eukprot:CAMPEP_0194187834 /NCGR_PEP_ID=MMETSP0154-20130528/52560_1 /TAXON_ID=1049557 /ORGANISM="Thalassiothrix antarctica, Strain L6-D1" /LENGTH=831 /DNA_ID=CAMNT_0038907817 /DNA_START=94 /DNA_END=2589 /DNA_ORIENTATION=-
MGNIHVFYHRIPALSTAIISSIAFGFAFASGLRCDFLLVTAKEDEYLEYATKDGLLVELYESNLGIACKNPSLFARDEDFLWILSYIFWIAASTTGALAVILSWLLTTIIGPTEPSWKALSVLSAISTVFQVPIFLMLEVIPCVDHICYISTSFFMLIISCTFWVTTTIITQCQDPPLWADELNSWRVQKEREEGRSFTIPPESKFRRWIRRRRWANNSIQIVATESGSVNAGGEIERMELVENGSYYANSNNSRLMLKVTPEGKRLEDDQKSGTSFGDIEEIVCEFNHERGINEAEFPDDEDEDGKSRDKFDSPVINKKTEVIIIHSHEDPVQYCSKIPNDQPNIEQETEVLQGLLENGDSPSSTGSEQPVVITGIRALAERMMRESRRRKSGYNYSFLEDERNSDADDESDKHDRARNYHPPMTPDQINKLPHTESPSPLILDGSQDRQLMRDWDALHSNTGGILLPKSISLSDDSKENDPEPVYYSSEESKNALSLTSIDNHSFGMCQDELSASTLSDSSLDEERSRNSKQQRRERKSRRRNHHPSTNSVASRTSLLDYTIEEETDIDLIESSEEENRKTVVHYSLKETKSPYKIVHAHTFPPRSPDSKMKSISTSTNLSLSSIPFTSNLSGVAPVTETEENTASEHKPQVGAKRGVNLDKAGKDRKSCGSETEDDTTSCSDGGPETYEEQQPKNSRRSRSLCTLRCNMRRSVYKVTPPQRGKSATPCVRLRDEQISTGGIHSRLISDGSSDDSFTDISIRSTVSLQARTARIKRLCEERHRGKSRSKSLLPSPKRMQHKQIILDPTLRAIMINRKDGAEYGPDEASL